MNFRWSVSYGTGMVEIELRNFDVDMKSFQKYKY